MCHHIVRPTPCCDWKERKHNNLFSRKNFQNTGNIWNWYSFISNPWQFETAAISCINDTLNWLNLLKYPCYLSSLQSYCLNKATFQRNIIERNCTTRRKKLWWKKNFDFDGRLTSRASSWCKFEGVELTINLCTRLQ